MTPFDLISKFRSRVLHAPNTGVAQAPLLTDPCSLGWSSLVAVPILRPKQTLRAPSAGSIVSDFLCFGLGKVNQWEFRVLN